MAGIDRPFRHGIGKNIRQHFYSRYNPVWSRFLPPFPVTNPQNIKSLLKTVGQYVDPLLIIERIPEGLEIPGLRDALQVVLRDSADRQAMWRSTERISSIDGMSLIQKLLKCRQRALFVGKGLVTKCSGCTQTLLQARVII